MIKLLATYQETDSKSTNIWDLKLSTLELLTLSFIYYTTYRIPLQ